MEIVPDDPSAKRIGPAPEHPSGYAPSEDAPVHVAPPLDLAAVDARPRDAKKNDEANSVEAKDDEARDDEAKVNEAGENETRAKKAKLVEAKKNEGKESEGKENEAREPESRVPDTAVDPPSRWPTPVRGVPVAPPVASSDVGFFLPVPVEERGTPEPPELQSLPDEPRVRIVARPNSEEPPPNTLDYAEPRRSTPDDPTQRDATLEVDDSPTADADREALLRDLVAMGALDDAPDRLVERDVTVRATLARARALRFRLTLAEAWPSAKRSAQAPPAMRVRPLQLDLALDVGVLAGLADGAPRIAGEPPASFFLPFVRTLVDFLRTQRRDLPRTALRDRGSATVARLTIQGWRGSIEALTRSARAAPEGPRRSALELGARVALTPSTLGGPVGSTPLNEHRFAALADLERALGLPTGSVAVAIDAARAPI